MQRLEGFPRTDPVVLLGLAPVLLYLLIERTGDVRAAIAASVVAAVVVFVVQRRLRPQHKVVFRLSVLGLAIMIVFGVLGLIEKDGKTFWTFDPVDDFIVGGIFCLSLLLGRPIVSPVIRELFPQVAERLPGDHRIWVKVTAVWAVKILLTGLLRLWLLDAVDASTYAIIRLPIGWAINLVLFAWSAHVIAAAMSEYAAEQLRRPPDQPDSLDGSDSSADPGEVVAETEVAER